MQRRAKRNKNNIFWVHKEPSHAEQCHQYLPDGGGVPTKPEPRQARDCPNCGHEIERKRARSGKGNCFWVHADSAQADACGHKFIDDDDGEPKLKEPPKTATCLACGGTLKRLYSQKTKGHFWVHEDDEANCDLGIVPDDDGVPDFPESVS